MKRLSDIFWLSVGAVFIGYFIYLLTRRFRTDHISKPNVVYTKATIISDRNYEVNHRATNEYTYSYSFMVQGKSYTGNSQDQTRKVGDTVEVLYDRNNPTLNKPLHPKE